MDRLLLSGLVTTDLAGLGLGVWLLWGRRSAWRQAWLADVLCLLALAALHLGGTLVAGWLLGGGFLVLRLWCHALFCVLAPLAIARGLQRRGALGLAVAFLGIAAEGAYVWARHVEPYRLQVRRYALELERLGPREGALRVGVLADLQTDSIGAFEERVFARLDAERVDLLLVPGDLLQLAATESWAPERAALTALFARLAHRPRLGMLMVGGDCEPRGVGLPEAGLRLLEDEAVVFPEDGLQVIGLTRASSRRPLAPELADAARAFPGLTIVLGHAPEFALSAPDLGLPVLCVAGHTHGGQVALPLLGPLVTLSRVPRAIAAGGLHRLGDSWLCVSRGIGMERGLAPRIRFLCPPELVVLDLSSPAAPAR